MQGAVSKQVDGSFALELTAEEYVFPLTVEQGGESYIALFHMMPYSRSELTDFLDKTLNEFSSSGRAKVIMEPTGSPGFSELFDRHFLRLSGLEGEPTVEEQKAWLARHGSLKRRVVQEGYGGAEILDQVGEHAPRQGLRLADVTSNRIGLAMNLWSTDEAQAERLTITHVLRPETADDQGRYTQATGRIERHIRKHSWKVLLDHAALVNLYDDMVEEVVGAVLNGAPCIAVNKAEWVVLVPCWHKVAVVQEVFAGASLKNG